MDTDTTTIQLNIRLIQCQDRPAVERLLFEQLYDEQSLEWVKELLNDFERDPRTFLAVAEVQGQLAGVAVLQRFDAQGQVESVRVFCLAIAEDYRQLSLLLVRELLTQSIAMVEKHTGRPVFRLTFEVDGDNHYAQRFFELILQRWRCRFEHHRLMSAWPPSEENPTGDQIVFNVWV